MRLKSLLASALILVGGFACGPGTDTPPDLSIYFTAKPYGNAACNAVDQRLVGQRPMRLYVSGSTDIVPMTQGLASYYHRHSLSFFTEAPPQAASMAYALDTNTTELTIALFRAFPGVDFTDEAAVMADPVLWPQVVAFVANFMFRPMVDFATSHSDGGTGVTNLIVVPDIERPGGEPLGGPGETLAGLAISPALLAEFARTMPEESAIWEGVNLPAQFTPMMVLGGNVLASAAIFDPELRDLVVAHEFGHTGALVHVTVPRNLMVAGAVPGYDDCTNRLDDAQLGMMRATLGVGTAASGALVAGPIGAAPSAGAARTRPRFTPDRLPALLAGDRAALRSFVEMMFHGPAAP
jgi:hypothetical protein